MPAGRKGSIALIVLCQSTQALAFGAIALFLPLIREDVALTFSEAGTLAVASTLTYAVMQIPSGYLADRFGPRQLFVVGLLGTNAMSFLFAVLQTYELLLVNQAVSGFFRSLVFAPGLLLISSHFAADRRATAMGLYVAGGFSSNVVLSLVGPLLVEPLGWRMLFMISSAIAVATVLLYWRVGAPSPPASDKAPVRIGDRAALLRHRVIWVAGVIQFVRLALVQAIRFWLPTFLIVDRGFSLQLAGVVVAVGAAVTAPANIVGGYVSDRLQRPLLVIGTSLAVLGASCVLLVTVEGVAMILLVVAVQSVFIQVYFGPLFEVPIRLLGSASAGSINGFSNFCANIGGLTFAYVLGAVKDSTGSFEVGFLALAGMCVVALVATWMLSRMEPRAEQGRTVPGPPRGGAGGR